MNPRNEAAALSLVFDQLNKYPGQCAKFEHWIKQQCADYAAGSDPADTAAADDAVLPSKLFRWVQQSDVQTHLQPGDFSSSVRGLAACEDLNSGSMAIRVPETLLITEETAKESDLGPALMQFTQLGGDSIAVIWTMVERHDADSQWAAFWQSLPETLHSGLTMSDTLLQALQGTSAHTECHSARQHIKEQYEGLKPILDALVAAYPAHLEAAWFSWDAYLWAVQLWYAYAMKVKWPDGSCKECLVPYASLLNHSVRPHIVQYGQLDAATGQLCFPLFRPVAKGHQCFLSYGPLSNLKLMLFYGMAIPDNPYDVVQIELEARNDHLQSQAQAFLQKLNLSLHHNLSLGSLPVSLQMTAAVLGMPADTLESLVRGGRELNIKETSEQNAIHSTLIPRLMNLQQQLHDSASMVEGLQQAENSDRMHSCVTTYLASQLHICKCALSILHSNAKT